MPENTNLISAAVPIPNRFFDELMPYLSDGEIRVFLVVLRATLGWREGDGNGGVRYKRRDWLTHSQLIKRTGKSSGTISSAVQLLVSKGLIVTEAADGSRLDTPELRRRYLGRVYFRPVDNCSPLWTSPQSSRKAPLRMTTDRRIQHRESVLRSRLADRVAEHRTGGGMRSVSQILAARRPQGG